MPDISKYDIFMKMLEIIQVDVSVSPGTLADERVTQITNIIHRVEGHILQQQARGITMQGDNFENISQSIIATRGSIAKGVVSVRQLHGDEMADALQQVETAIADGEQQGLASSDREEALALLAEIAKHGGNNTAPKPVLKALATSLWGIVEKATPVANACLGAWKVLEKMWT